jgi:hypothetical protein
MCLMALLHERAAALAWLCALCCVGCGVYDPTLVQGRSEQAQNTAGTGSTRDRDAGADGASCEGDSACNLPHSRSVCVSGRCLIVSCTAPFADCDDRAANGCEADLTSAQHCGLCNSACRFNHAGGQCNDGRCSLGECDDSYDNCDGNASNGCEQKVDSLSDCGSCGTRCDKPAHATAACRDGSCGVDACDSGWGDCNGDAADGCEQQLDDPAHCGACDSTCNLPHTQQSECENAQCVVVACADGFEDCNGAAADGCEGDLAKGQNCGACGRDCDLPRTDTALCAAAECQVDHGSCGSGDVTVADCGDSRSFGCARGYADCDNLPANGCETDLSRLSSCGSCVSSCVEAHAETACRDGRCVRVKCDAGYGVCNEQGGCQSLLDDANNCGSCGNMCTGATPRCFGGQCTADTCDAQRADCDDNNDNGCETSLTSRDHCGSCGARCADAPNASMTCDTGTCAISRCQDGFADCDKDPRNGCEVALNTLDDCGACGSVCAFAHSSARCEAGRCERTDCSAGYADCNSDAADGCETNLLLPDNCRSCGNSCKQLPDVAGSTCGEVGCVLQCVRGRGDCDNDSSNGCETDLNAATSCGACAVDCTNLANVRSARCGEGVCGQLQCQDGFADCNGNAADGCERALNTLNDCGACDKPCAMAHAQADCSDGTCQTGTCDEGFADCDGAPSNGCETALNDATHCGSCTNSCPSGTACLNGACGCQTDAQCANGGTCCDGRCLDTRGSCYVWPCIPSTELTDNALHCGGCGSICLGWCCGDLL